VGIARWVLPEKSPDITSARLQGSRLAVEFSSQPNIVTILEKSPTLSPASWSEIFRTSDTNGVTFQIDADNAAGFFRLRAE
jgi:hypothetical protein